MTLDIVTKGIPYLHMTIVTAMVFAGVPRIISFTAMLWGVCAIMSIPLTEEEFYLEFPSLWRLMAIQTSVWLGSMLYDFTECLT